MSNQTKLIQTPYEFQQMQAETHPEVLLARLQSLETKIRQLENLVQLQVRNTIQALGNNDTLSTVLVKNKIITREQLLEQTAILQARIDAVGRGEKPKDDAHETHTNDHQTAPQPQDP